MKQCMNGFYGKANFKKYKHEYLKTVKEGRKEVNQHSERQSSK